MAKSDEDTTVLVRNTRLQLPHTHIPPSLPSAEVMKCSTHCILVVPLLVATHEVTHLNVYFSHDSTSGHIQTQVIFVHYLL